MRYPFLIILLLSICLGKYSYSDKCYRFELLNEMASFYYQIYVNRKGFPLSYDYIKYALDKEGVVTHSHYYHNVLTNCEKSQDGYNCTSTCESVWFKIWDKEKSEYGDACTDPAFLEGYANIMDHPCVSGETDIFKYVKAHIGEVEQRVVSMNGKKVLAPKGYSESTECIWEWEILGLVSLVTVIVIVVVVVVALIVMIALIFFVQKHRSNKRKRLDNALIANTEKTDIPIYNCLLL